jgi:hypothetical protein
MTINKELITRGFILAGLMNMSVLMFSRVFTNEAITQADPIVMSNFGLLMIVVWGLAYISVAKAYDKVKWLVAVFAIEKLIYAVIWTFWHASNDVSSVFEQDVMAGVFYTIYGLNDYLFMLFFSFVFIQLSRSSNPA